MSLSIWPYWFRHCFVTWMKILCSRFWISCLKDSCKVVFRWSSFWSRKVSNSFLLNKFMNKAICIKSPSTIDPTVSFKSFSLSLFSSTSSRTVNYNAISLNLSISPMKNSTNYHKVQQINNFKTKNNWIKNSRPTWRKAYRTGQSWIS